MIFFFLAELVGFSSQLIILAIRTKFICHCQSLGHRIKYCNERYGNLIELNIIMKGMEFYQQRYH